MKSIYTVSYSVDSNTTVASTRKTSVAADNKKAAIKEAQKRFPEGYLFKVVTAKPCVEKKLKVERPTVYESADLSRYKDLEITDLSSAAYGEFGELKEGYIETKGGLYKLPSSGYSKTYKSAKFLENHGFRYNYKDRKLEAVSLKEKKVIDSMDLPAEDFFDGPQYWVEQYAFELQDDSDSWM